MIIRLYKIGFFFSFPPRWQFYHNQITFAIIIARAIITKWTQYAVRTHAMIIARAIITHVGTIQCSKIANGGETEKEPRAGIEHCSYLCWRTCFHQ